MSAEAAIEQRDDMETGADRCPPREYMSSDYNVLENTVNTSNGAPRGIARKPRSDKGQARVSRVGEIVDRFMDLPPAAQGTLLDVLEALWKKARRTQGEQVEESAE